MCLVSDVWWLLHQKTKLSIFIAVCIISLRFLLSVYFEQSIPEAIQIKPRRRSRQPNNGCHNITPSCIIEKLTIYWAIMNVSLLIPARLSPQPDRSHVTRFCFVSVTMRQFSLTAPPARVKPTPWWVTHPNPESWCVPSTTSSKRWKANRINIL